MNDMTKSRRIWLLVGILIIATFLRFYHLTTTPPGLYPDEAMNGNNAAEVIRTGDYKVYYPENNGREGLFIAIQAGILKVVDLHEPWVLRLPSAVAGVLTVLGLYLLAAELFGAGTGLLAAFLLATSFWHINFSRIGFRAILAPLLLAWAAYLLIKAYKTPLRRTGAWYAVIAGIVYSLGLYTYIAYRITPLLFLLFIPFYKKYPDFWKRTLLFIVAIVVVAAPIGWYFLKNPADFFGRTAQISVASTANPVVAFSANAAKTLLMFNIHGDDNWRHNYSGAPELFWPVGILFVLGIALGIRDLWTHRGRWKKSPQAFAWLFIFLWFILAMLPAAASDEGLPHALRSILMLPAAIVLAAAAGIWCYEKMKGKSAAAAKTVAVIFIIAVGIYGYVEYFVLWARNPNVQGAFAANYVEIGREINALPVTTPKYVVVLAGGVMARGLPVPAETVLYITNTFLPDEQAAKNVHYLLPGEENKIPPGTPSSTIFYIR